MILLKFQLKRMSKLDPKSPYKAIGKDIKIKVDLSNYATKTDLKM